jgi:hypothetical protein
VQAMIVDDDDDDDEVENDEDDENDVDENDEKDGPRHGRLAPSDRSSHALVRAALHSRSLGRVFFLLGTQAAVPATRAENFSASAWRQCACQQTAGGRQLRHGTKELVGRDASDEDHRDNTRANPPDGPPSSRVGSGASSWFAVAQQLPLLLAPTPIRSFVGGGAEPSVPSLGGGAASVPLARRSMPAVRTHCDDDDDADDNNSSPTEWTLPANLVERPATSGARPYRRTHRHGRTAGSKKDVHVGRQGRCQIMRTCVIGRVGMLHDVKDGINPSAMVRATFGRMYIELANIYV